MTGSGRAEACLPEEEKGSRPSSVAEDEIDAIILDEELVRQESVEQQDQVVNDTKK